MNRMNHISAAIAGILLSFSGISAFATGTDSGGTGDNPMSMIPSSGSFKVTVTGASAGEGDNVFLSNMGTLKTTLAANTDQGSVIINMNGNADVGVSGSGVGTSGFQLEGGIDFSNNIQMENGIPVGKAELSTTLKGAGVSQITSGEAFADVNGDLGVILKVDNILWATSKGSFDVSSLVIDGGSPANAAGGTMAGLIIEIK